MITFSSFLKWEQNKMEQNKKYVIRVDVGGKIFTYTGIIISEDEHFVTFKSRGEKWTYNKDRIISFEEVGE